jgi:non-heme chloroperoxidase
MRFHAVILSTVLAFGCMLVPRATWAQVEIRSGHFLTSDVVKLHYLEAGTGPTLVFVPGWTMPAEIWEHQIRHFASSHRVVALDPRGQGRSEKVSYGYHPSRRARDIGELLEHLGGEPAVLVGWSLGVQEVLVYTQESGTEAIRAAILVDHAVDLGPTERLTSRFISMQVERREWTRWFIELIHHQPQTEEYLDRMTQAALSTPTNAAAIMIANIILMGPTDLSPALESLDRPVLFVYSSLDWAVAAAEEVRKGWPALRVEVIDETSHALFVDKPDEFNRLLEDFLAMLPE